MADLGHSETDKILQKLEVDIDYEYGIAAKSVKKKMDAYLKQFKEQDKQQKALVKQGLLSQSDYDQWRLNKWAAGKRWEDMKEVLSQEWVNRSNIAHRVIGERLLDVYALNFNYAAYQIETGYDIDTSFTLYDRATVERLLRDKPDMLPQPGKKTAQAIAEGKIKKWSRQTMQSVMTQGILQGQSIPEIAKNFAKQVGDSEKSSAIRNARTMTTSAECAGRVDSYKRAEAMGIKLKQVWVAALDGRTRHQHRLLDGQMREVGKPFEVEGEKIMYPGDLTAPGHLVYNCRCTLIPAVQGTSLEKGIIGLERDNKLNGMSYDDWKYGKEENPTKIKADIDDLKAVMANLKKGVFSGIWKDDVSVADYAAKKDSIQAKKDYYNSQLDKYAVKAATVGLEPWEADKIDHINEMIKELYDFEEKGKEYADYEQKLSELKKKLKAFSDEQGPEGMFDPDAYTEERKNAANKFRTKEDADKFHRRYLDSMWDDLSEYEKYSVWEYTHNSHPMNRPLSGYEEKWDRAYFKGVGKARWGLEDKYRGFDTSEFERKFGENGHPTFHKAITSLTNAIQKSEIPEDTWFVRGSDTAGLAGLFEGDIISYDDAKKMLRRGNINELKQLLKDQVFQGHSFLSTGIADDAGFGGEVKYKIYAPKGTHAIYAEPASYYGDTVGMRESIYKNGQSYRSVGGEAEVIFQRGTKYRLVDIEYEYGDYTVILEVVEQPDYFKYGDEETFNNGATRHLT